MSRPAVAGSPSGAVPPARAELPARAVPPAPAELLARAEAPARVELFACVELAAGAGRRSSVVASAGVWRRVLASLVLLTVAATAACSGDAESDAQAPPFADCAAVTAAPPSAPAAAPAAELPDLRLPCFTGGKQVALRELHGPALINIWASSCGPCRTELPVIQRTADRAAGRLTVLSVDSGDLREAGASFAADKGVTLPTLFDQDNKLLNALGRINLPITVFVDTHGRQFVQALPLTAESIDGLIRTHTGVAVAP